MDWFLYDKDLRHERVKLNLKDLNYTLRFLTDDFFHQKSYIK